MAKCLHNGVHVSPYVGVKHVLTNLTAKPEVYFLICVGVAASNPAVFHFEELFKPTHLRFSVVGMVTGLRVSKIAVMDN